MAARQPTQDRTAAMTDEQPIGFGADLGWGVTERLENEAAVNLVLDDIATRIGPSGHQIIAGIGPYYADGSCEPFLFIGLKDDHPAAYLRWDTDIGHEPGYDQQPTTALLFDDGIDGEVAINPDLMQASQELARQAVQDYVATGKRPASVDWVPADEPGTGD